MRPSTSSPSTSGRTTRPPGSTPSSSRTASRRRARAFASSAAKDPTGRVGARRPPRRSHDSSTTKAGAARSSSTAREYESVREAFRAYVRARVQAERRRRGHERASHDALPASRDPRTACRRRLLAAGLLPAAHPRRVGRARLGCAGCLDRLWRRELRALAARREGRGQPRLLGSERRSWSATGTRSSSASRLPLDPAPRSTRATSAGDTTSRHSSSSAESSTTTATRSRCAGTAPGMQRLPGLVRAEPPLVDTAELVRSYWEAEVHLVAGHPRFPDAVFPSKFWNARATGRPVLRVRLRGRDGRGAGASASGRLPAAPAAPGRSSCSRAR